MPSVPALIAGAIMVLCAGCGDAPKELFPQPGPAIVWPAAPDPPRIRFIGQLSTQNDIEKETSWSHGFGELLFGKKPIGVMLAPYAMAVDDDRKLFVADPGGPVVHVFDLKKRTYSQFSHLNAKDCLAGPVGIGLIDDKVYVVDSSLHQVCVFDKKGRFKFSFGGAFLERPSGIAYYAPADLLYITDTAAHKVAIFTRDGTFIRYIGSRGTAHGQFNYPTHLWADAKGNLFVSDTLNYRVQVFNPGGGFIRAFGRQGDRPGNFAHPCGVATDSLGNIYVIDRQYENVQIFDSNGRILMALGGEGSEAGQFWLPAGICTDHEDRIYVADCYNKRVQIFEFLKEDENADPNQ